jgi:hypothetical protein
MFPASPAKSWKPHWLTLSAIRPSKLTAAAMRWISAASLWKRAAYCEPKALCKFGTGSRRNADRATAIRLCSHLFTFVLRER